MSKIKNIIEQIELDYLQYVESDIDTRRSFLPLTDKKQIKAILWNILTSEKYKSQISYNDYSKIFDELLSRIKMKKIKKIKTL